MTAPGAGGRHTSGDGGDAVVSRAAAEGTISVSGTSHAKFSSSGGTGGPLTLDQDANIEILRFVLAGGTLADVVREK
jgi:hypothetical protein